MKNKTLSWAVLCSIFFGWAIPFLSWILSVFGFPIRSLYTAEGLRWLFREGLHLMPNEPLYLSLLVLSVWHVWRTALHTQVHPLVRKRANISCVLVTGLFVSLLLLLLLHPSSPLLGVTGAVTHSPFMQGIVPVLLLYLFFLGLLYAYLVGAIRTVSALTEWMTAALRRYALWLLFFLCLSFDYNLLLYIIQ